MPQSSDSLLKNFSVYQKASPEGEAFLERLETSIDQDLWKSFGGHWSSKSIRQFRMLAMQNLAKSLSPTSTFFDYEQAWKQVVRDFHQTAWGEKNLAQKEPKPQTQESKIFWELFPYVWTFLQATIFMKLVIVYFGLRSVDETAEPLPKIYVVLAILFSFGSLGLFAYRHSKKEKRTPNESP